MKPTSNSWSQKIPVSWWLFSISVLILAACLTEIFDFFQLPFETSLGPNMISAFFLGFIGVMYTLGYGGLFLVMFLENMSLPIPSEVFLPLAGYFVYIHTMNFWIALTVASIAGLLGSVVIYGMALALGRPAVYKLAGRIGVSKESLVKSESWLSGKGGSILIFFARFTPGIRSSISIPAGVLKMNPIHFTIMTLLGTIGWSGILIYVGYSIGPYWSSAGAAITNILTDIILYGAVGISAFYAAFFVYRRISRRADAGRGRSASFSPSSS